MLSLIENGQATIHGVVQIDPGFGVALAAWTGRDLQAIVVERNGVVVGHYAGVLEAEVVGWVTLLGPGQKSGARLSCFDLKAGIELGQVSRQEPVGTLQVVGSRFAQFFDQPILQGTPQPFDTPFGLWAAGGDQLDAQFVYQVRGSSPYSSCSMLGWLGL